MTARSTPDEYLADEVASSGRVSIVTRYGRTTHVYLLPAGTTRNQALGIAARWKREEPRVTYSVCAPIEVLRP